MFDFHLHSNVSFDTVTSIQEIIDEAIKKEIREICFTDHYEYYPESTDEKTFFSLEEYSSAYDTLRVPGLMIRKGLEFGMTEWNKERLETLLKEYRFDFVIGSIHTIDGLGINAKNFCEGKTLEEIFECWMQRTLTCIKVHDDFDVLGHLTYGCRSAINFERKLICYQEVSELTDEIFKVLIQKGKGLEINTSTVDSLGDFSPSIDYLRRFKELGGEIITVGSDAHHAIRVGQYIPEALKIAREVFGYVCTFKDRTPIFHEL